LSDSAQPGTYQLRIALDAPADVLGDQVCFAPAAGETNLATVMFTSSVATGQLMLSTGSMCLPTDLSIEAGAFSIPFTVQSGTGDYAGASGSGVLTGNFDGSILGGSTLTFLNLASANFSVPVSNPCLASICDPGLPPPSPGATPELDSLVLFGSGLTGVAAYLLRRRRASRIID
jgi:hypothetical protein